MEYVFLGDAEANYLKTTRLDYLITQLQLSKTIINSGVNNPTYMIGFVNPVKELYFAIQSSNLLSHNEIFNYSNPEAINKHHLLSLNLEFNGETIIQSLYQE